MVKGTGFQGLKIDEACVRKTLTPSLPHRDPMRLDDSGCDSGMHFQFCHVCLTAQGSNHNPATLGTQPYKR